MTESEGSSSIDFVSPSKFKEWAIEGKESCGDRFTNGYASPLISSHSSYHQHQSSHDRRIRTGDRKMISSESRINFDSGLPFTTSPFHDRESAYKIEKKYKSAINYIAKNKNNLKAFRKNSNTSTKLNSNYTTNQVKSGKKTVISSAKKRRRQSEAVTNLLLGLSTVTSNPISIKSGSATPIKGLGISHTPSKDVKPSSSSSPPSIYTCANSKIDLSATSPYTLVRTPAAALKTRRDASTTPSTNGKLLPSSRLNTPVAVNIGGDNDMVIGRTPLELSRSPLFSMKRTPSLLSSKNIPKTAPYGRQSIGSHSKVSHSNSNFKSITKASATKAKSPFSLTRLSMSTEKLKITPLQSNRQSLSSSSLRKSFGSSSQANSGMKSTTNNSGLLLQMHRSPFSVHRTPMSTERPRVLSSRSLKKLRHSISASSARKEASISGNNSDSGGRLIRAKAEYPLDVSPEIKEFAKMLSDASKRGLRGGEDDNHPDFDIASSMEGLDLAAMNSDEIDAVASSIDTYLSKADMHNGSMHDGSEKSGEDIEVLESGVEASSAVSVDETIDADDGVENIVSLSPLQKFIKSEMNASNGSEVKVNGSPPKTPSAQGVAKASSSIKKVAGKGSSSSAEKSRRVSMSGGRLSPTLVTIPANTITTRRSSRLSMSTTSLRSETAFSLQETESAVKTKSAKTPKSGSKKNRRKTVGRSAAAQDDDDEINSLIHAAKNMILNADKVCLPNHR